MANVSSASEASAGINNTNTPSTSGPSLSSFASQVLAQWETQLLAASTHHAAYPPDFFASAPRSALLSSSIPDHFFLGTGRALYTAITHQILQHVSQELLLVTCFWARSSTSEALAQTLRQLSVKALSRPNRAKIRVRICFSSLSLPQKLFHTASLAGQTYGPETWVAKFGLPEPSELEGLEMTIKSVFVHPFSVMHPKFVILDRTRACVPSANVSWEEWFEGAVWFEGEAVTGLVRFWNEFWAEAGDKATMVKGRDALRTVWDGLGDHKGDQTPLGSVPLGETSVPTLLLPSSHHRNPQFRPFLAHSSPPPTPLNLFLLIIFSRAQRSIVLQTPNVTAAPVQAALVDALARGVNVTLTISPRLMVVEQLVTAGQTSECAVAVLKREYAKLVTRSKSTDLEAGRAKVGALNIRWYKPLPTNRGKGEPVKSHLKLTVVDDEIVVLGSGNLDRASWYTSQELGIAFFGQDIVLRILNCLTDAIAPRFYNS
ncbi:MAG: hypothetical protein M1814_001325 [Vezdaea aestivalis]|nr:MAG: hypothetical protein M1814_001325 [Vezdaea aestivalis]